MGEGVAASGRRRDRDMADRSRSTMPSAEAPRAGTRWLARRPTRQRDARAAACLVASALVLIALLVATTSHSEPRRSGSNGVGVEGGLASPAEGGTVCQPHELVPAGTASVRIDAEPSSAAGGPAARVTVSQDGALLGDAQLAAGWQATTLAVPISPTERDLLDAEVCFVLPTGEHGVRLPAGRTPPLGSAGTFDGDPIEKSIRTDWYRAGSESWWSYAATVAERLGRGRGAWGGASIAWAVAALVLVSWVLAGRLLLSTVLADAPAGRSIRGTAASVAAIAFLSATAWSLITPPFLVPDEISHVAYVQQLAETGQPPAPRPAGAVFSPELEAAMAVTRSGTTAIPVIGAKAWTAFEQRRVERTLGGALGRRGNGTAGDVDPEPPTFYALEAVPYRIAYAGTLLDRLALMRLLSATMAGATALLAFLFVRECLPGRPWAWTVGGLVAAFAPVLGFVSGGVNPDALLFPICAALFLCLARAFRRGMTTRRAVAIGVVLGAGMVAKINFYGLAPGAFLAVLLAARESEGRFGREALRLGALVIALALAPLLVLSTLDALVWERPFVLQRSVASAHADRGDLLEQLGYVWQFYLPRLPGMQPAFDQSIAYEAWFKGFVGEFSGLVLAFPEWVYRVALALFVVLGVLVARALRAARTSVRSRRRELLGYAAMAAGLLALIALVALRGFAPEVEAAAQGRYLLPLLPLFGAFVALAARGAGPRWGRGVGAALVVAAVAWSLFGQLVVIAGFYG